MQRRYHVAPAGLHLHGGALQYAQTLVTRPVRIETIQPGDTVGYGRTFRAGRETVVMTLPIGYGDGYPRILGNRAPVLVKGRRALLIGRVCMDMVMAGKVEEHNRVVKQAIDQAALDHDCIVLAQGSMTAILPYLGDVKVPVLTSPELGVKKAVSVLRASLAMKK